MKKTNVGTQSSSASYSNGAAKELEGLVLALMGWSDSVYVPNDTKDYAGVKVTYDVNYLAAQLQLYIEQREAEARINEVGKAVAICELHNMDTVADVREVLKGRIEQLALSTDTGDK